MDGIAAFFAPLALLFAGPADAPVSESDTAQLTDEDAVSGKPTATQSVSARRTPNWLSITALPGAPTLNQVRIEQRVILRISPRNTSRRNLVADLQSRRTPTRYVEERMGKCLKASSIAWVQADKNNRLLLFMRDKGLVAASLEKSCSARDFYSGFYVERSEDGNLCANRDELLSRSGAKCEFSRLRRLVPEDQTR